MKIAEVIKLKNLVVDASVVVKWFSDETDSLKANQLLAACYQDQLTLFVPDLLIYEVGNALWKGKKLDQAKLQTCLDILYSSPLKYSSVKSFLQSTINFMYKYDLTFYDAAYVGLAASQQTSLITANPKDHAKVKDLKVIDLSRVVTD
jgi:predicted nucleic acid-binding protein